MAINWTEADIEKIIAQVVKNLGANVPEAECQWNSKSYQGRSFIGVYEDMNDAIVAANAGYKAIRAMSVEDREKLITVIRRLCREDT